MLFHDAQRFIAIPSRLCIASRACEAPEMAAAHQFFIIYNADVGSVVQVTTSRYWKNTLRVSLEIRLHLVLYI
jgi:hypothetical protein